MGTFARPWKSKAMSTSGPTASRTARARATAAWMPPYVSMLASGGQAFILIARARSFLRRRLGCVVIPAGQAVDLHAVAHAPAQQAVHRQVRGLARDVPQRHLDPGQRAHVDAAPVIEAAVVESAHQALEIVRRLEREPLRHGVHAGPRALEMTLQGELAEALDPIRR